jgi:hypothetical protein
MTQYHVLASEGLQRYTIYTKNPEKYIGKKKIDASDDVRGADWTLPYLLSSH